jgi:hypothetical protein
MIFESLLHIAGKNNPKLPLCGLIYFTVTYFKLISYIFLSLYSLFLYSISFVIIHND